MERKKTCYPCHIWGIEDAEEAGKARKTELVRDYGQDIWLEDGTLLNYVNSWEDDGRYLLRCRECGGLMLKQHVVDPAPYFDDPDLEYFDWIPVATEEEGGLLNILLGEHEMDDYPFRHLRSCDGLVFWSEGKEPVPAAPEELKAKIREKYAALKPKQKKLLEKLMDKAGKNAGE